MREQEIIVRLKQGDKDAFATLYNQYWKKVYSFVQLYITKSVEVEEIVQEVFIKLWESHETLDEDKNLEGYLFIITRNLIFYQSRKYFNELSFKLTVLNVIEESYNIEEELEAADLKRYIDKLISHLPPRQQEVFKMSREQQLSNREIAERLSISEKAVERNIYLALKFLKKNHTFLVFVLIECQR